MTLTVSFQHRRRGDVSVDLFSPSGTRNEMLSTRRYDDSKNGLHDWTFMTVHNWGENPKGVWVMNVTDNIATLNKGVDVNGYLQHDTSKQEADVEDLEEEVSFLVLDNSFTWAYTYNSSGFRCHLFKNEIRHFRKRWKLYRVIVCKDLWDLEEEFFHGSI